MKRPVLFNSIAYGIRILTGRRVYIVCLALIPLLFTLFFISLMDRGVATRVSSGVVDLDQSQLSRRITRNLAANQMVDITEELESFHEAVGRVRSGEIYGFFMIPSDFQQKAIGGGKPTITYYCNMTYFVPGSMVFKGFKTIAVTTMGGLVETTLVTAGMSEDTALTLIQPVAVQTQGIANPWMNYNYYLTSSFVPGIIALMVALVAAYSICEEMKRGSSVKWLQASGGSMLVALFGKLLPQAVLASLVGIACQAIMYGFNNFPLNGPASHMVLAMILLVVASQAFAVTICCLLPNLRLAVSICSLTGILAFSIAAFSFPVEQMYPEIGVFSYILPVRYYFLIYVDQALNGIPLYYSRYYYIALLIFPVVALLGIARLKKHCLKPVYVP